MAVINSIPPQAYTRDTLVKAIEWMNTQPQAIRERASSADLLVSYYLQACRKAAVQNEAPVSQESFKQDLRHLAEDLKKFEEPSAPPTPIQPSRSPSLGQVEPLFVAPQHQNSAPVSENGVYHYIPPQSHIGQHGHASQQHQQQGGAHIPMRSPAVHAPAMTSHHHQTQPDYSGHNGGHSAMQGHLQNHGHYGPNPGNPGQNHGHLPPQQQNRLPVPQWSVDPKSMAIAREVMNRLNLSSEAEALRLLVSLGAEKAKQLFP